MAVRPSEDVPAGLSVRARLVPFPGLPLEVCAERADAGGRQGDAPLGADGLGRQTSQAAPAGALESAADARGAAVEVEVFPAQAEEFALSQPGAQGELEQRGKPVALGSREELPGFVGGERVEAPGRGVPVRTFRAALRGISSSRTACSSADLSTEWMYASVSGESRLRQHLPSAQQRGDGSPEPSGRVRRRCPRAQQWQTVRSSFSQVRTSLAVSLASFFLPRPGIRYWCTTAVYRVWVVSRGAGGPRRSPASTSEGRLFRFDGRRWCGGQATSAVS